MENNVVELLRKVQLGWELDLSHLSKITHVSEPILSSYFKMTKSEIEGLPSIPQGLDSAIPLISIFKQIQKLIPESEKQNEWLTRPNDVLEGNKPIEVMAMSPAHLAWVSYTLDSSSIVSL